MKSCTSVIYFIGFTLDFVLKYFPLLQVHIGFPIFFMIIMTFLILFPLFYSPFECLMGLFMVATGIPVYCIGVLWKSKPQSIQRWISKYTSYTWIAVKNFRRAYTVQNTHCDTSISCIWKKPLQIWIEIVIKLHILYWQHEQLVSCYFVKPYQSTASLSFYLSESYLLFLKEIHYNIHTKWSRLICF